MKTDTQEYDQEIEDRIAMEIIVDAYPELEHALGWHYYLQDHISFPFKAICIKSISSSPIIIKRSNYHLRYGL